MNGIAIGIDFGTTKTLVAFSGKLGEAPTILNLGREQDSIPTSAFYSENGTWEIGDEAEDHASDVALADRYTNAFKLKLGAQSPIVAIFDAQGYSAYSAREITAQFLAQLRKQCKVGENPASCAVVTYPVDFSPAQVEDLKWAATHAGFSDVTLVHEPVAAGLAYCRFGTEDKIDGPVLVVDWGGGTLDLALISISGNQFCVHEQYAGGINTVGGNVFDELLWEHISKRLQRQFGINIKNDPIAFRRIQKREIRKQKEKLSRPEKVSVYLSLPSSAAGSKMPRITLTKAELEQVITPTVTEGIRLIQELLSGIQENSLKPTQIVLVGGSSRIPLISKRIADSTGLPCHQWKLSHESVAMGAALWLQKDARRSNCQICGGDVHYIPGQDNVTCACCQSSYQVSRSGQISYVSSRIKCSSCSHLNSLDYLKQEKCHHCGAEYQWDVQNKKWDSLHKSIRFNCAACNSKVAITGMAGTCGKCGMQYSRTWDSNYKVDGVQVKCFCGHVSLLCSNNTICDKCGRTIRWDYASNEWNTGYNAGSGGAKQSQPSVQKHTREKSNQQNSAILLKQAEELYNKGRWAESIPYYEQSAQQGNPIAQYKLGQRYLWGNGVRRNRFKARNWIDLAAQQGHKEAIAWVKHLENQGSSTVSDNNRQPREESGENKSGCLEDAINMLLAGAVLIGLTVVLSGGSPIAILVVVVLWALGFIGHFYGKMFK